MKMKTLKLIVLPLSFLVLNGSLCDGNGSGTGDPDAGLYHTYAELTAALDSLASDNDDFAQKSSIGQSIEGRELWAIKISDNVDVDEDEPNVVLMGAHHAREWISVEVPLMIAEFLIEQYPNDPGIKTLVDGAQIWIVPMVNPDGHQYAVTQDRLWRKNRRNNGNGSFGVDLNRNYSYQWGGPGSSGDTYSEIYRGPAPFSEPETQACRDFLQSVQPKALISYHNFSQLVLFPWSYTDDAAPDKALLEGLAVGMADLIKSVHGRTYVPEQGSELYLSSGDTTDWLYGLFGAPAFTIELRPKSVVPGFQLPESEIKPTFEENLPAALYLMEWAM